MPATRPDAVGLAIAFSLLALAGAILWNTTTLQIASVYGLGPKAMPFIVASGLVLLAIGNGWMALRGSLPARDSSDSKPILLILGGFALLIALVRFGGGFIPATAVLFAATCAAFGRRALFTDLAIGLFGGVLIYLLFARLLTLSLPMGPLERLL